MISGVNNTDDKIVTGVVDTADQSKASNTVSQCEFEKKIEKMKPFSQDQGRT
jgi:hypothetical protein